MPTGRPITVNGACMEGQFDFEARVLMCGNCGAPLETGFAGGTVKCGYCGTTNVFEARREAPVEPRDAAREMDEDVRLELLRRQDGSPPEIPSELNPLMENGVLADWKVDEALSLWRSTCRQLASRSDYAASERLYYLTVLLSNHFSGQDDALRERAMYESALDVMTLPRHRQILRGMLARKAARAGNTEAARKWLEPCNPRSHDLESDSSYRVSMAEILTVEEDWKGVLEVLGEDIDQVPVTSLLDGKAIVQRANALEHLGRIDEAAAQLQLFMQANGASGRRALRSIARVYSDAGTDVCPRSLEKAESDYVRQSGESRSRTQNPGGCFGQIFTLVGAAMVLLAILLPVLIKGAPLVAGLGPGIAGVVFLVIGINHVRKGRRIRRLHSEGVETRGRLESIQPTGWKINGVPQYQLTIAVESEGGGYRTTLKMVIPPGEKEMYSPGSSLELLVDPRDPQHVTVVD